MSMINIDQTNWEYNCNGINVTFGIHQNVTHKGLSEKILFPTITLRFHSETTAHISGTLFFDTYEEIILFLIEHTKYDGIGKDFSKVSLPEKMFRSSVSDTTWLTIEKIVSYKLVWDIIHQNGLYTLLPKNLPHPD